MANKYTYVYICTCILCTCTYMYEHCINFMLIEPPIIISHNDIYI